MAHAIQESVMETHFRMLMILLNGILTSEKKLHRSSAGNSFVLPVTKSEMPEIQVKMEVDSDDRQNGMTCAGQEQKENIKECCCTEITDSTVEA